jgi:hypothetical protein
MVPGRSGGGRSTATVKEATMAVVAATAKKATEMVSAKEAVVAKKATEEATAAKKAARRLRW